MTDFYEELPCGQINEDLYEDLPGSAFNTNDSAFSNGGTSHFPGSQQYQHQQQGAGGAAPPPLPTSAIPQSRQGGPPTPPLVSKSSGNFPPIPSRSPSTQLTSGKVPPQDKKKGKESKKKNAPAKPPPLAKGGGVNMAEMLQKAKARRPIEDLEKSFKDGAENEEKPVVVPWANQLRKASTGRHVAPEKEMEEEVPEFIRKARTLSIHEDSEKCPPKQSLGPQTLPRKPTASSTYKPAPALPSSAKSHGNFSPTPPKPVDAKEERTPPPTQGGPTSSTVGRKLAPTPPSSAKSHGNFSPIPPRPVDAEEERTPPPTQGGVVRATPKPSRPAPTKPPAVEGKPPVPKKQVSPAPATKPAVSTRSIPPLAEKLTPPPPVAGRASNGDVRGKNPVPPPQVMKGPRPTPSVRNVPGSSAPITDEINRTSSPQPSSFANREPEGMEGGSAITSETPSASTTTMEPSSQDHRSKGPPPLKPPRHDSSFLQDMQPPVPNHRPLSPKNGNLPPQIPAWTGATSPVPPETEPDPVEFRPPPPPPKTSPPPSTPSPISASSLLPPLPGKPPMKLPPPPPVSMGQSTPPMESVMKFRRLPLLPVDLTKPPSLPSRDAKGVSGGPVVTPTEMEEQDVYEDTLNLKTNGVNDMEEELYDDVSVTIRSPAQESFTKQLAVDIAAEDSQVGGTPEPVKDEEDLYEDLPVLPRPHSPNSNHTPLPPAMNSSSLAPPSPVSLGRGSPTNTPSHTLKKLAKEEKKKQEKLEKEIKKKNEVKMKNKQKGLRAHKQFSLMVDVKPLFTVEVLENQPKSKDHLPCSTGEILFVLLIAHEKMSSDKYFVEKEDGCVGFVKKIFTQRVNYKDPQSILSQAAPPIPQQGGADWAYPQESEDIYESLPQDGPELPAFSSAPPLPPSLNTSLPPPPPSLNTSLPPPNVESHPPANFRFPAPMVAPPPPPPAPGNGPEEMYEYLPEDQ